MILPAHRPERLLSALTCHPAELSKLCKEKRLHEAVQFAASLSKQGVSLPKDIAYMLMRECTRKRDKAAGEQVHSLLIRSGLVSCALIRECLVQMLATCGSLKEATEEFDELLKPSLYAWNAIISAHTSSGDNQNVMEQFIRMQQKGINPDKVTFSCLLKVCTRTRYASWGRHLHELIIKSGFDSDRVVCNTLINLYAKCKCLKEAHKVFDNMSSQDVFSWGAIITGYAEHADGVHALQMFDEMNKKGIEPNVVIFLSILKACSSLGDLTRGSQIYDQVIREGLETDTLLSCTLIDMYAKSGGLMEAHKLFGRLQDGNAVSWGALIAGYAQHGNHVFALQLFQTMKLVGVQVDNFIYSCILKACGNLKALQQGRFVHNEILSCRLNVDVVVGNSLIDMYSKCGSLNCAQVVFDGMKTRDVVSWSAIIVATTQHNQAYLAFELYSGMQQEGYKPDQFTFSCILKACGSIQALRHGRLIHGQFVRSSIVPDLVIGNALIDMYSKCGSLHDAKRTFDGLPRKDVVSWSAMIAGYAQNEQDLHALELFERMQREGIEADSTAFSSVLKACSNAIAIQHGRLLHDQVIKKGYKSDLIIGNTLMDMYCKCGSLEEAKKVFDDLPERLVAAWGVMIAGYAQHGHDFLALELFFKMHQEGVTPDKIAILCMLKACGKIVALQQGRLIHDQVVRFQHQIDVTIGNALIDMYGKCGSLEDAHAVFERLQNRNVVSWDALITAYVQQNQNIFALRLWERMQEEGIKPIKVTFLCALKACCSIGAITQGRLLHDRIVINGLDADVAVSNTLIDMYAKCGSLGDGVQVFNKLPDPDVVSWSALVGGYGRHGAYALAKQCLEDMQQQGLRPNDGVYSGILNACRQGGLVEEGRESFKSMSEVYSIKPCLEHYSCMVDLLGNAGYLEEAFKLILAMNCEPDAVVWTSLLNSSRLFNNLEIGLYCIDKLVQLNPSDASTYVLMSNMYAGSDMLGEVDKLNESRKSALACRISGMAWLEVNKEVHQFVVDADTHPESNEVYLKMKRLCSSLKEDAHVPHADFVSEPIIHETQQDAFSGAFHHYKLEGIYGQHIQEETLINWHSACVC